MIVDFLRLFAFIMVRFTLGSLIAMWVVTQWWGFAFFSAHTPDIYCTAQGVVIVNGNATNRWLEVTSVSEQKQFSCWDDSPSVLAYRRLLPGIHKWYAEWSGRISRIGLRSPILMAFVLLACGMLKVVFRTPQLVLAEATEYQQTDGDTV